MAVSCIRVSGSPTLSCWEPERVISLSDPLLSLYLMICPTLLMEVANEMPTACQELTECCVDVRSLLVHSMAGQLSQSQHRHLEMAPGMCCTIPRHLSECSATHTCCSLPATSFKEVRVPKKSKPLGRLLGATVALLS
jgi:hypothetical protein